MTVDVETFPGRTVTLHLSAAQLAYLRVLLFEDLQKWAEALASEAQSAHETGKCGDDVHHTFRRLVTTEILDLVGWDTARDLDAVRWLEDQARAKTPEAVS